MYKGREVQNQDLLNVEFERRNPILADLFNRMLYMERCGSGLKKILEATAFLPGYRDELKPKFHSDTSFQVTLYNVNYNTDEPVNGTNGDVGDDNVGDSVGVNVGVNVGQNVGHNVKISKTQQAIISVLAENPRFTAQQLSENIGISKRRIESNIKVLREVNKIKRIGSDKSGYWEVVEQD